MNLTHLPLRVLTSTALSVTLVATMAADPAPSAPTPPTQSGTANYTDYPRHETYVAPSHHHSSTYYPSNDFYRPYHPAPSAWIGPTSSPIVVRNTEMIFYPPTPPVLGDAVQRDLTLKPQLAPPQELASYLHEIFAPQLGTLLFHNDLPKKWRQQVETYRSRRDAAADALRARLESTRSLDASARAASLRAFSLEQADELAALETEAERLRELLTNGDWFNEGSNWNEFRRWRLGDNTRWESHVDEFRVLRAAIFYQRGLSMDQRDLLREMIIELETLLEEPMSEINLSRPAAPFAFAPAPARLRLPVDLPGPLAERIASYQEQKTALKRELRDEIYQQDRAWSAGRRAVALRALAEQQAPRFAELHALADDIRVQLQSVRGLTPSASSTKLPAALTDRINRYLEEKTELQDALTRELDRLRAQFPFDRIEFSRIGNGYGIVHVPSRHRRRKEQPDPAALSAFNAQHVAKFEALAREKTLIQEEVKQAAHELLQGAPQRSVESLLREFAENAALHQRWSRYHEYQDATLQPGLSLPQRRLLFGVGLNRLMLPFQSEVL